MLVGKLLQDGAGGGGLAGVVLNRGSRSKHKKKRKRMEQKEKRHLHQERVPNRMEPEAYGYVEERKTCLLTSLTNQPWTRAFSKGLAHVQP